METNFNFTQARCAAVAVPEGKREVYVYDDRTPGLALRVAATGVRTFFLARRVKGSYCRIKLGRFPDISVDTARNLAERTSGEIAAGKDPMAELHASREAPTMGSLFDYYIEAHAKPYKRSWQQDQDQYDRYLVRFKRVRLEAFTQARLQRIHAKVGKRHGNYAANRLLALLSKMFGVAGGVGFHGPNPAKGIRKFQEQSRERYLAGDELPRFFAALDAYEDRTMADFFRICLMTGARRANVQAMRWDQVFFERGVWVIPETKTGSPLAVPLSPAALDVLRERMPKDTDASPWVFPSWGVTGHITEPKKAWQAILNKAQIKDLRVHDLRRTLGSWQAATGASLPIIGKSLGHKQQTTTQIYARLNLDPVREAVNRATVAMLGAGKPEKPTKGKPKK